MTKEWWINWLTSQEEWFLSNYWKLGPISTKLFKLATEYKIEFLHGCTKGCIVDHEGGFVIKWTIEDDSDEMHREFLVYQKAVSHGVECFFPKTELLLELGGYLKFYIQQRVSSTLGDMPREDFEKCELSIPMAIRELDYEDLDEFDFYWRPDTLWIKKAIAVFGVDKVYELASFTRRYHINDLHTNNVGFDGENFMPMLLDFSGFNQGALRSYSF